MSIKSKATGMFAAAFFGLTLVTGVFAQTGDSETVSVELTRPPVCAVDLVNTAGTFGVWQLDADTGKYAKVITGNMVQFFQARVTPTTGCEITITFDGLTGPESGVIPASNFTAYSIAPEGNTATKVTDPSSWVYPDNGSEPPYFSYTLDSVPDSLPLGTYTGEINVAVTNAT